MTSFRWRSRCSGFTSRRDSGSCRLFDPGARSFFRGRIEKSAARSEVHSSLARCNVYILRLQPTFVTFYASATLSSLCFSLSPSFCLAFALSPPLCHSFSLSGKMFKKRWLRWNELRCFTVMGCLSARRRKTGCCWSSSGTCLWYLVRAWTMRNGDVVEGDDRTAISSNLKTMDQLVRCKTNCWTWMATTIYPRTT